MPPIRFQLNGQPQEVELPGDMPLLWVLRDHLQLTGTRYSCGAGMCGSCLVLIDGEAKQSCITTLSAIEGREVVTIEGLSTDGDHPVQKAWIAENVPQCGYCQSGQILNAVALLRRSSQPSETEIGEAMDQVLCRCGTYKRIRRAIERAAEEVRRG